MAKSLDNGRPDLLQLPGSTWHGVSGIPKGEHTLSYPLFFCACLTGDGLVWSVVVITEHLCVYVYRLPWITSLFDWLFPAPRINL